MPQIPYRANLSSASYPLTLAKSARSVIINGYDQVYDRLTNPVGGQSDARAIPQAVYMENVIPTPQGYQSVGFTKTIEYVHGGYVQQVMELTLGGVISVPLVSKHLIGFYTNGVVRDLLAGITVVSPGWSYPGGNEPLSTSRAVGRTFVLNPSLSGSEFWEYTFPAGVATLATVAFTGLPALMTWKAMCSSFNYNILVDYTGRIYWSSTTNPTDFVPSLVTGAGSEIPTSIRGIPICLKEHPSGFLIYTSENVVSASYTGNARYPFKFREVADSGSYWFQYAISGGQNASNQLGITSRGLIQELNIAGAVNGFQEVSDFLSNSAVYDIFDYNTNTFTEGQLPTTLVVNPRLPRILSAVWSCFDNYIFISYSTTATYLGTPYFPDQQQDYDYAFVYDKILKRWGKIKFTHCFIGEVEGAIFLIQRGVPTDQIFYLDTNIYTSGTYAHRGVLILGKFQLTRSRRLGLERIDFESTQNLDIQNPKNFTPFLLPSLDGVNFQSSVTPFLTNQAGTLSTYNAHTEGVNVCIGVKGAFDLTSLSIECVQGGKV